MIPKSNKHLKAVSMGFGIDGVEDIVSNIIGGVPASSGAMAEI